MTLTFLFSMRRSKNEDVPTMNSREYFNRQCPQGSYMEHARSQSYSLEPLPWKRDKGNMILPPQ